MTTRTTIVDTLDGPQLRVEDYATASDAQLARWSAEGDMKAAVEAARRRLKRGKRTVTFVSEVVFACHSAACRPPGKNGGTGGSLPSRGTPGDRDYVERVYAAAGIEHGLMDTVSEKLGIVDNGHPPTAVKIALKQNGAERVGHQIEGEVDWSEDIHSVSSLTDETYQNITSTAMRAKTGNDRWNPMDNPEISAHKFEEAIMYGDGDEFAKLYKETTGIPLETVVVHAMQQAWGSNFGGPLCRAMMHSAKRVLPMDGETEPLAEHWEERGDSPLSDRLVDRVLKQVYDNTQADLKRLGVSDVTVVRGVRYQTVPDGDFSVKLRPLSSWSVNEYTAHTFGHRGYSATVPASRIFSTANSGFGCSFEHEVILLGGTYAATGGDTRDLVTDG